ncbi:MAG: translocation/assembly module TamB domain-containing protein [Puia sp.]|nr:translocation/assembly module TamB domain-containing protein [Puia sp.]
MASFAKKFVRRVVRVFTWIVGGVLILVIIVFILIQVPSVQRFAKGKLVSYLEGKLGTKVEIRRLALSFPGDLTLENVYFEDRRKDTLLYGGKIEVRLSLWKLLDKEISVSRVELDSIRLNVYRQGRDTVFNYDYILRAFSGTPAKEPASADTASAFTYHLGDLVLHHIVVSYQDDGTGNEVFADLGDFTTNIRRFDPAHSAYSIPGINLSGLVARVRRYKPSGSLSPAGLPAGSPGASAKAPGIGNAAVKQTGNAAKPVSQTPPPLLSLQLGTIGLEHIAFDYQDEIVATKASVNLGTFRAVADASDWQQLKVRLRELDLKNSKIVVSMGAALKNPGGSAPVTKPAQTKTLVKAAAHANTVAANASATIGGDSATWQFEIASLLLDNNDLQYDDNTKKKIPQGIDYNHLKVDGLVIHGDNLQITPHEYRGRIASASFTEQSGFTLRQLSTRFLYNDNGAQLKDLDLRTGHSEIRGQSLVKYPSLQAISRSPGLLNMDLSFDKSRIALRDVLSFVPALAASFKGKEALMFTFSGKLRGSLRDLDIPSLELSAPQNTFLSAKGHIRGLPNINKAFFDLQTVRIGTGSRDLENLLPKGTLPSSVRIPDHLLVAGNFRGGIKAFRTKLALQSSSGNGQFDASLSQSDKSYDIKASLDRLNLGALLRQEQDLGLVTLEATLKGDGFDYKTLHADLHAELASAVLKGYSYTGLALEGSLDGGQGKLHAAIRDTSIRFNLDLTASDLARKFPAVQMDWQLDTLDLHALHLLTDTLGFRGLVHADFADTNPDSLQGRLTISGLSMVMGLQHLSTDSILLLAQRQDNVQDITLHSEMADVDWKGVYKVTETADALQQVLRHYYGAGFPGGDAGNSGAGSNSRADSASRVDSIFRAASNAGVVSNAGTDSTGKADRGSRGAFVRGHRGNGGDGAAGGRHPDRSRVPAKAFQPQDWTIELAARPSPLVLARMPSLKGSDSIHAHVAFRSQDDKLLVTFVAPRIQYGSTIIRETGFTASTDENKLAYRLQSEGIVSGGIQLYQTAVYGWLGDNRLYTSLLLKDEKTKDRYRLSGQLNRLPGGWKFLLNPDSLLLNYDRWQVSRDNYLQTDSSGIVVNDFVISHNDESLKVNSITPKPGLSAGPGSPIDIVFRNFQISTLSKFANQDSLLVDGVLNGKADIKDLTTRPVFTSDLKIENLSYQQDTIGDLAVKVNNVEANTFATDLSVTGHDNDLRVTGKYYTGESRMDLKLDMRQVNLFSVKPFAAGQLKDIRGLLKGQLAISGTPDKPVVNGDLHFENALITPEISGEPLKLSNDNIEFDADGFNFSQFSMQDSAGNKAIIDGNVYTKDYRDYRFDVSLNAVNFRLVNAPAASNRQFYGALNMDASANISGDISSLKVLGGLRVNRKTDFFFVLPGSDPEIVDRAGVVRFIDKAHPGDTLVNQAALMGMRAANAEIKGMDISLNIETDSNAVFTMVLDERTGDQLTARGRSNLVFGMDKSGKIDLTGGYEVESGSYNLSLDVLKRKFDIQHGSTITWTGDPTTAILDLTATYAANTPSIDLIANEMAGRSETEINKFKQKLPFLVTLKMEGELLKPKITFDITLPTNILALWPDVDQKLQQIRGEESELNKQVFALLLLNRFVGDDPLQSAAGGGASVGNMAFQSASQILTSQLDQLAGSLIKGVDIHFDLNNQQDYSTGTEQDYTELNVSVSKRLFNDRIQVNVGSNFDVMGTGNPNQNASNLAGDVAVDYKLTKDGRYMLRAYRKNQYEAVLEGQVVETGVSFILTFDYNHFKELFKTREQKQERKLEQKQEEKREQEPEQKEEEDKTTQQNTGKPSNQ